MPASSGWRGVRSVAKGLAAVLAALAFAVTGYGWVQLHTLTGGLNRGNVIESAAPGVEQNILLVGLDSRTDAQGEPLPADLLRRLHAGDSGSGGDSADTLIVVHIAAGGQSATAISIPRDSYVELADGLGQHKINSAYAYGKNAELARIGVDRPSAEQERAAALAGARVLIDTVESLTGLSITHYAALNLVGFYQLSQAVGGVPVCLRAPVYDSYTGLDLPAGAASSPASRRWPSSASGTACPGVTWTESIVSRSSSPHWPTRCSLRVFSPIPSR
jgi:LCP family protein required for cell wall assembly